MASKSNTWEEYSKLVLHELERLNVGNEKQSTDIQTIKTELTALKIKISLYGGLAGAVVGIVVQLALNFI